MSILFNKIDALCDAHGITITELCRQCKISRSLLSDLKFGRIKTLNAITLQKIATFFNVTVEYFLSDGTISNNTITGSNNIIGNGNVIGLSEQEQALVDIYRELDVIKQAQLLSFAAQMKE